MRALLRRRRLLHRGAAVLLLPLSILPFVLIGPSLVKSHELFDREHNAGPLAAPQVVLTRSELARWRPLPAFTGAVPVLAYGGIDAAPRAGGALTRRAFARQLALLSRLGFRTISIRQFARFRAGLPAGMPARPVLISFDGGRLDSYRGADRVLQHYGMRATMFVATGEVQRRNPDYLTWRELHAMSGSGRWDIQAGATRADARTAIDARGSMAGAYAYRRYTRSGGEESFADWQQRVTGDVFSARSALVGQGFDPVAFSVPFGDYGQAGSNDARIAPYLRSLLSTQFAQAFTEAGDPPFAKRAGDAQRLLVRPSTSAGDLYGWLRRHDPVSGP